MVAGHHSLTTPRWVTSGCACRTRAITHRGCWPSFVTHTALGNIGMRLSHQSHYASRLLAMARCGHYVEVAGCYHSLWPISVVVAGHYFSHFASRPLAVVRCRILQPFQGRGRWLLSWQIHMYFFENRRDSGFFALNVRHTQFAAIAASRSRCCTNH